MAKRGLMKRISSSLRSAVGGKTDDDEDDDKESEENGKPKRDGDITVQFKHSIQALEDTAHRAEIAVTEECKGLRDESHKLRRTLAAPPLSKEPKPTGG